jgi:hypothetical protein
MPEVIVDLKADGTVDKVVAAADRRFVHLVALWDAMDVG